MESYITRDIAKVLAYNLDPRSLESFRTTSKTLSSLTDNALDQLAYKSMVEKIVDAHDLPNYPNVEWRDIYDFFVTNYIGEGSFSDNDVIVQITQMSNALPTGISIILACEEGDLDTLKTLLSDPKVIMTPGLEEEIIRTSIRYGHMEIIKFVADLFTLDDKFVIVNSFFSEGGYVDVLQFLIQNRYITYKDITDYMGDNYPSYLQNDVINYLARVPEFMENMDLFVLLLVAIDTDNNELALELIDNYDVDINEGDSSPLQQAIRAGNENIVLKLLSSDKLQLTDEDYNTCLSLADSHRMHKLILDYGKGKVLNRVLPPF